jgi:hypothetical protein
MILGVGLSVFGAGEGDASAQVSGPGISGIIQGGMCAQEELSSTPADVNYFAGNGGVLSTAWTWVQCPVTNVTGLIPSPLGAYIWIENTGASSSTCQLHRVNLYSGNIVASTTIVAPANMSYAQPFGFSEPSLSGGFYSLECFLASGATVLGYYVNMAN